MHCGSCHQYVEPEMLDKDTWLNKTLPEMGLRLGIGDVFSKNVTRAQQGAQDLESEKIYPLSPKIHEEDFQKIVDFIVNKAPENPLLIQRNEEIKFSEAFDFVNFLPNTNSTANVTALTFFEQKVVAASPKGKFVFYDTEGNKKDSLNLRAVFSTIKSHKKELYGLNLGMLGPHEKSIGSLYNISENKEILKGLHKPADFEIIDINEDGIDDYAVCNFGFETGSLAWYDGKTLKENVLKLVAGARNIYVKDMNNDGKKDLIVLYAQALEGISIFYNKGKGRFLEEKVLEFSPVFGSSWIELSDFNQDGKLDILYVNGDNADYSGTLKKYHGIRIFENKGKFEERFFFPLYGATKALAVDFDQDGDLDIMAIAYYRNNEKEGLVYLENKGNYVFEPYQIRKTEKGQWMTLEIADINQDGMPDVILGAHDLVRRNKQGKEGSEIGFLINKFQKK